MNKRKTVEKYLMQKGCITSLEMQNLVYTTSPHRIIKDLRDIHGYNAITDEWITKTKIVEDEKGKKRKETIRYKKFIWNGETK